jgi:signal transduction histidine kinase/ligand-binding sensor domain-containing protein/DNA-binding response OmpR family regulator
VQDAQGFMWFGSRDGLNRFNGYSFRIFRNDSDLPHSIGNNMINSLLVDQRGNLWIGTNKGLYRYNSEREDFTLIPFSEDLRIGTVIERQTGDLWIVSQGKLLNYNVQLDHANMYTLPDNSLVTHVCITSLGQIWVTGQNGFLYELIESTGTLSGYDLFAHSPDITSRNITRIYPLATSDKIFIGTYNYGVKLFDINTGDYTDCFRYDVNQVEITVQDFLQVDEHTLWIATESGLYVYDLQQNKYTDIKRRPYDPYSLTTNSIYRLYKDREQGIWLCTYAGGINYYSTYQPFTKYYTYPGENVMQGDLVHDICTDQYGNLWIATEDAGVNKYEPGTGKYSHFSPQPGGKGISHVNIHGMIADEDKLWIGNILGTIDVMDIRNGRIINRYRLGGSSSASLALSVVNMKKMKNGSILAATSLGLFIYNKTNDNFEFIPQYPSLRIQSILEDHEGVVWVGTVNYGLYYYNPLTGESGKLEHDTIINPGSNTINDIYEDHKHNLWLATLDGLKKYDRQSRTVKRYTLKNGMPGNVSYRILPDENGNLWISTTNGLVCMDPETEKITIYRQEHGLISNQFNYNSGWRDKKGRLYFGMVRGMISFDPQEIKPVIDKTKAVITGMTAYGINGQSEYLFTSDTPVKLSHEHATVSINFSAMSYLAPGLIQYTYCMEGFDRKWMQPSELHYAYYTRLPPGNYTFKVKTTNVSGLWNDNPAIVRIQVLPPWWLSDAAKIGYLILLAACGYLLSRFLMSQNKKKITQSIKRLEQEKETELYQAKISFFINIAHEIRTPLTLIKSPLDKVMKNQDIPKDARPYLSVVNKNTDRLLALINQLLDFRKTEIDGYSLNFMKTDIELLLSDICDRFRNTAEEDGLSIELKIETNRKYAYVDKEACTKIISNLLTNAIKHGRNFILIKLFYSEEEDMFQIEITNDGEQIPAKIKEKIFEPFFRGEDALHKQGTGLGLPLARSLAEMHRGSLSLINSADVNTTFRLCLPVNQPNSIRLSQEERTGAATNSFMEYKNDPSRSTILVIEDNVEMKDYIGRELNAHYNIITAAHGKEALVKLEEFGIQLIMSDIMMPVMDGFAFLRTIKTNLEYSHIPVILLTARNTIQSRLEGLELGADAYIEKPFTMDILLAQIANLLTNRENIRNSYSQSPVAHLKSMAYTKADENFLERLNEIILDHISDTNLDVDRIVEQMNLSRATLYRKISALSNLSPNELIRIARLKKAAELILEGELRIYEIAETVGFNSQSYFSRSFTKQFGMSPSEYVKRNKVIIVQE